tara:strand:- start:8046 stop:10757 length:2712 start_codon:yes stop_codon:yes gene_type:complete
VATYGVDIEIGVKGQQRLQSLTSAIKLSGKAADSLAKSLGERGVVSQSIDNYNKALQRASRTLQGVIAGTKGETKAVKEYAAALNNLIAIQERQKKLVGAEFRATAAGQAELELTKAKKSLEIKRKQGELQRQQDRDREAIQKALGRMEFEQAARRREFLAQGTRELKEQLELSRQIFQTTTSGAPTTISRTVQKRPAFGGGAATAFGPQPDRIKRLRRAEIFDRTAAARRENEARREQFRRLEETARGARIQAAREENRNAQQLIVTKKDELALQKRLGEMEKRSQAVADRKNKSLRHSFRLGKSIVRETVKGVNADKARTKELEKQNALARQQRNQRLRSAVGSGLIGGGFPLLFGQTGAAAVGGALGGLGGGLIGGEFGFALSVVGTAIGQAVAEAEKFDKALAAVNAKAVSLGSSAQGTVRDVKDLAKELGITKDEALELVGAFSEFENFADKQALARIFGDSSDAFDRLAAAKTELDLAKEIFAARGEIGNSEAERLLNALKITDASTVELALAEARLQAEHDIAVEKARQVTFMDRLRQSVTAGFGGGVIDVEEFGEDRAERLNAEFIKNREEALDRFVKKLKEVRDLIASVELFDPGKPPAKAETGESIEQRLKKQLARYEEIEPFARKRAIIEADHRVTLEKIAEVKDKIKRKDLEILAGQVRQARLDDVRHQELEQAAKDYADLLRDQKKIREEIFELQEAELKKTQELVKGLTDTMRDGFVDSIKAATDETRTLADALANMLNRLSDQLLNIAANMAFYGNAQGNLFQGQGIIGSLLGAVVPSLFNVTSTAGPGGYTIPNAAVPKFRANGGAVGAGRPYIVGERGPELFVPGAQGNVVSNSAMGGTSVIVNVDASGTEVQGNQGGAEQLGRLIGSAVQAELIKQKRPGGLLTR